MDNEIIKLKANTFYYLYVDGDGYVITENPPVRRDGGGWWLPNSNLECKNAIRLSDPKSSNNILEFCEK